MPSYGMTEASHLLGVSTDTVRRWADGGRLLTTRSPEGHRLVEGGELARFAVELADAPDSEGRRERSVRNRFTGIVTRVVTGDVVASVEIQAGPFRVVAVITAESVTDLGLEPGVRANAVVKATSVMIERG